MKALRNSIWTLVLFHLIAYGTLATGVAAAATPAAKPASAKPAAGKPAGKPAAGKQVNGRQLLAAPDNRPQPRTAQVDPPHHRQVRLAHLHHRDDGEQVEPFD